MLLIFSWEVVWSCFLSDFEGRAGHVTLSLFVRLLSACHVTLSLYVRPWGKDWSRDPVIFLSDTEVRTCHMTLSLFVRL